MKMKKNFKLFVWEGVLCDNTGGMMVALAETEKEAQDLIIKKAIEDRGVENLTASPVLLEHVKHSLTKKFVILKDFC